MGSTGCGSSDPWSHASQDLLIRAVTSDTRVQAAGYISCLHDHCATNYTTVNWGRRPSGAGAGAALADLNESDCDGFSRPQYLRVCITRATVFDVRS